MLIGHPELADLHCPDVSAFINGHRIIRMGQHHLMILSLILPGTGVDTVVAISPTTPGTTLTGYAFSAILQNQSPGVGLSVTGFLDCAGECQFPELVVERALGAEEHSRGGIRETGLGTKHMGATAVDITVERHRGLITT